MTVDTDIVTAENERAREPLRRCIATRESLPKEVMIRFALAPDGTVTPDLSAKLPGRGAWVVADRAALERAVKHNLFARAFGEAVKIPTDLVDLVGSLLARRCLELFGQCQGAGLLALGAATAGARARDGALIALFIASDAAADGRRKTLGALRAGGAYDPAKPYDGALAIGCFTSAELSLALGRENVIHAGLLAGGLSGRLQAEARRLAGFRPLIPDEWAATKAPPRNGAGS